MLDIANCRRSTASSVLEVDSDNWSLRAVVAELSGVVVLACGNTLAARKLDISNANCFFFTVVSLRWKLH
jgi:intracellular sulfur oxidation DsrE/DsrF family protein